MDMTSPPAAAADCLGVSEVLGRIGDKWTVQVVVALHDRPRRFNDLKREIAGISQQMLTRTLKLLERDGMLERTVHPSAPPQVEYALSSLGRSLSQPLMQLAEWAIAHRDAVHESRVRYDASQLRAR